MNSKEEGWVTPSSELFACKEYILMEILFLLFVVFAMLKPIIATNSNDERDSEGIKNEHIQRGNSKKL